MDAREVIQVTTTAGSREEAYRIAGMLVDQRLAACVQVAGPITSRYWWNGTVDTAEEWVCVAKTTQDAYVAVEAAIKEAHTYEVPEILATPVTAGNQRYLGWVAREVEVD